MNYDVVIVGAGAAGLGAAKRAHEVGLTYRLLEAAPLIGGRAITVDMCDGQPFDLGCHWLQGGTRNPFRKQAKKRGKLGAKIKEYAYWSSNGFANSDHCAELNTSFDKTSLLHLRAQQQSTGSPGSDRSIAQALNEDQDFNNEYLSLLTHECAAEPNKVSVSDPAGVNFGGGDIPVLSGYGRMISDFAERLETTVNCPVYEIDYSGKHIKIETPQGTLSARKVLITVSTEVLAREHISFGPNGLPNWKLRAIDGVATGSSTKVGLLFKPGTLSNLAKKANFLPRDDQLLIVQRGTDGNGSWHFGTGEGDLCVCYIGGTFSQSLALAGRSAQIAWATDDISRILGSEIVASLVAAEATPFDRQDHLGGGYSYCRVGYGNLRSELARPIEGRLFFAGEACADVDATTAHGAWNTGVAAMNEIKHLCACPSAARSTM